jgi:hypothetical protein
MSIPFVAAPGSPLDGAPYRTPTGTLPRNSTADNESNTSANTTGKAFIFFPNIDMYSLLLCKQSARNEFHPTVCLICKHLNAIDMLQE